MAFAVKLAVRKLVEFVLRGGDLTAASGGFDRAQEGARLHRQLQKAAGGTYRAEVALTYTCTRGDITYTLEGRADGVYTREGLVGIDEIKTTALPLDALPEAEVRLHWAQAMSYAYIYAVQNNRDDMQVQLTHVQAERGHIADVRRTQREYTRQQLEDALFALLDQYAPWAQWEAWWQQTRTASIQALAFPFDGYREGQRRMATAVYRTISREKIALIQAPTGIGKTISALFPAVKALGEGLADKLFYLTAKNTTRRAACEALDRMRDRGLRLKSVVLTAKDDLCFQEKRVCDPLVCPYAAGHYDRVNDALFALLQESDDYTRERIEQAARAARICPYELARDLTDWSDCVVGDYNYLFDPAVALKRFFTPPITRQYVFLIDEAHNLLDRAREMYSCTLRKSTVWEARKLLGGDRALGKTLLRLNKEFVALRKACGETGYYEQTAPIAPLNDAVIASIEVLEGWLASAVNDSAAETALSLYFELLAYRRVAEGYDDAYITAAETGRGGEVTVRQCCLDPASMLRKTMDCGRASVLFSATLTPLSYYARVLGGGEDALCLSLPSPYAPACCRLLIADRIHTRYTQREGGLPMLADWIVEAVTAKPGNYMVYFPSYAYLKAAYAAVACHAQASLLELVAQQPDSGEEARAAFLERFSRPSDRSLVGFCVLGGVFAEGIDLQGDRLIGSLIVGVGLPQWGREQERLRAYYERRGEPGYDYAYRFPGMNKVLQAAGRVIRGEADRGVILLMDDRFNTPAYLALFPDHWREASLVRTLPALRQELRAFWTASAGAEKADL